MPKTATIYFRTDPDTKEQAEQIFAELGLSMSGGLEMLLKAVVRYRGIPFEMKLPPATAKEKENASPTVDPTVEMQKNLLALGGHFMGEE